MESMLTSDIFFFITALAVILITGGLLFLGYRIYRIVEKVEEIADRLSEHFSSLEDVLKRIPFFAFLTRKKTLRRKRKETKQDE